ncbi:MAG: ABC transporter permease [Gammaproteobacteria bacterium]|nr:ABC transporter permease [Gammaproteobacteria bacterium]
MMSLLWSSLFRRKARTLLTLLSVIVAFLLFGLLRSVAAAFTVGVDIAGVDRLVVQPKYSIIDPIPLAHLNQIAAIEGVANVTHADWFGGIYQDRSNFFPKFPVDARGYFSLYPEYRIDPAQLEAFANTRTGAVAPKQMLEEFGWKIGDRIPIEADIWPKKDGSRLWEFELVGSYDAPGVEVPPSEFLFQYDYFDEARQYGNGGVGWFIVRVTDPAKSAETASAIDRQFENSPNATRTATEAEFAMQFANQVGDIGLMMTGILGAVFFTIVLLTANTMAQALRERIPELAVLKTLGFTDVTVAALVLGEAVLLCALGGCVGLGIALLLEGGIATAIKGILPTFAVSASTLLGGVALAVVLGLAVGMLPALRAQRLNIIDALREH